jgi:hypothetical protein
MPHPLKLLRLFCVTAMVLATVGCNEASRTDLDAEVRSTLEKADALEIFAIEPPFNRGAKPGDVVPQPTSEKLYEYPVYGSVQVTGAAKSEVIAQVFRGLVRAKEESTGSAECFDPRHAIRATHQGRTVDLLICFSCNNYEVHVDGERRKDGVTENDARDVLNKLLKDAKVPLSPGSEKREKADESDEIRDEQYRNS